MIRFTYSDLPDDVFEHSGLVDLLGSANELQARSVLEPQVSATCGRVTRTVRTPRPKPTKAAAAAGSCDLTQAVIAKRSRRRSASHVATIDVEEPAANHVKPRKRTMTKKAAAAAADAAVVDMSVLLDSSF